MRQRTHVCAALHGTYRILRSLNRVLPRLVLWEKGDTGRLSLWWCENRGQVFAFFSLTLTESLSFVVLSYAHVVLISCLLSCFWFAPKEVYLCFLSYLVESPVPGQSVGWINAVHLCHPLSLSRHLLWWLQYHVQAPTLQVRERERERDTTHTL